MLQYLSSNQLNCSINNVLTVNSPYTNRYKEIINQLKLGGYTDKKQNKKFYFGVSEAGQKNKQAVITKIHDRIKQLHTTTYTKADI